MTYETLFVLKLHRSGGGYERIAKAIELPFNPSELPKSTPVSIDEAVGTRRVDSVGYSIPEETFVVKLAPNIRLRVGEEVDADALERRGWENPNFDGEAVLPFRSGVI